MKISAFLTKFLKNQNYKKMCIAVTAECWMVSEAKISLSRA
jgi:hypothetical protein